MTNSISEDLPLQWEWFSNIMVVGVDTKDYPDFCDAYIEGATWRLNGTEATEEECIALREDCPDDFYEACLDSYR
jgi:hypothetical protein